MGVQATVVFTDLHGSTAVFESLGNARATETVTQITGWIGKQCEVHGGRLVKTLGDGVLALFSDGPSAVAAVIDLQRIHQKYTLRMPQEQRMAMRIGVASGEVELIAGDCYGDAVNVASRLCDLCSPHQIWANAAAIEGSVDTKDHALRLLGPISIRGRAEPCTVYQIEWREEEASDLLTMQGVFDPALVAGTKDALGREIQLGCGAELKSFRSFDMPVHIGRVRTVEFMVNDPRVSRTHARLEWRNGSIVLVDVSSYGCWLRFAGGGSDLLLRREECVLHGQGEIALGTVFTDETAPIVKFSVS